MPKNQLICRRQFIAICFLSVLSPVIRTIPSQTAQYADVFAWLSVFVATVPLFALLIIMLRLQKNLAYGEGVADVFLRILGKFFGRAILLVVALWLIFYCGFTIRSAAVRFVSTIYPQSSALGFIPFMALLGLVTALGSVKALGRTALFLTPMLVLTLAIVFVFAVPDVDFSTFYLPNASQTQSIFRGSLQTVNALSIVCYFAFLEGYVPHESLKLSVMGKFALPVFGVVLLLLVTTIGSFGAVLTAEINNPFFVMVRNLRFFSTLERLEALVIAIWFFTDYVLISAILHVCTIIISKCMSFLPRSGIVWLSAIASAAVAVLIGGSAISMAWLSFDVVPYVNMAFTFGVFPLVFAVGMVRRRV